MNDRLYRSRDDRMLAGVAGGLAEYWDADPSLIRIIWALLVLLTGGVALVIYIVMAFVVPDEDALTYAMPATPPTDPGGRRRARAGPTQRTGGRTDGLDPAHAASAAIALRG